MNSLGKLHGKVAVVTGGNSGLGLATAKRFAAEGAHVYVLDLAIDRAAETSTAIAGDVANGADLDRFYEQLRLERGRVDILFANAGVGEFGKLGEIREEHFDRLFSINVKGMLFTVQKALPLMPDGGSIILASSTTNCQGIPAFSVYSAGKAAIRSFARSWAMDLKDRRIRVNAISPGPIDTPGLSRGMGLTPEQSRHFKTGLVGEIPLGRLGQAD